MAQDRDGVFAEKLEKARDFEFGAGTAKVFDDMLDRSVPQYGELQRMIGELAGEFALEGTRVYDLGCSTGITMRTLDGAIEKDVTIVGMDYSQAMLDECHDRLESAEVRHPYELRLQDLNDGAGIEDASVVVLNLTLQFIRPIYRDTLIRQIFLGLELGGCLILVEKVLGNDSLFNRLFIQFYYDMKKRNGYSELEIAQKREALENVLIPYRYDENIDLLRRNGFAATDMFWKWYNFCGMVAVR